MTGALTLCCSRRRSYRKPADAVTVCSGSRGAWWRKGGPDAGPRQISVIADPVRRTGDPIGRLHVVLTPDRPSVVEQARALSCCGAYAHGSRSIWLCGSPATMRAMRLARWACGSTPMSLPGSTSEAMTDHCSPPPSPLRLSPRHSRHCRLEIVDIRHCLKPASLALRSNVRLMARHECQEVAHLARTCQRRSTSDRLAVVGSTESSCGCHVIEGESSQQSYGLRTKPPSGRHPKTA